jgi:hypothetical protein
MSSSGIALAREAKSILPFAEPLISGSLIAAALYFWTATMEWRFSTIIQDDVDYMTRRMMQAPGEMPWPRDKNSSFPYGIHEELGLHSKIQSIYSALNHGIAVIWITCLTIGLLKTFNRNATGIVTAEANKTVEATAISPAVESESTPPPPHL